MRITTRFIGITVMAFGAATLIASAAASFATGSFLVDIGAPIVVVIGVYVARGSARAARIGLVVMACYALLPVMVLVVKAMGAEQMLQGPELLLGPEAVEPLARALRGLEAPWVAPACLAIGACAAAVTVLLAIAAWRLRRGAATTPPPPTR